MTTELKPGTPEYQEAYTKEMERLEAAAGKSDAKEAKADDKADTTTPEVKAETKTDEGKTETADEIKARLEAAERDLKAAHKAIKDTQRWGHKNAEEVARLKKDAEERKRNEKRPAILDANEGLEDAIKHVAGAKDEQTKATPQELWLHSVSKAIPDVEALLGDQAFFAKAREKQVELGPDWDDPFIAIRELSELKVSHQSEKRAQAAVEAARKDFESKSKKRSAMEVPGGSGGKDQASKNDEAERIRTMSQADFQKMRSKVMGY